ncbi:MAG: membrane-bound serine protease (ClpP class) [Hyphomicrobiaceae bacterium]|jgi:membrane-bound serine protease (ClpP class)
MVGRRKIWLLAGVFAAALTAAVGAAGTASTVQAIEESPPGQTEEIAPAQGEQAELAASAITQSEENPLALATRTVHRMVIAGPITPAVGDYLSSAIDRATAQGSAALIIELDTPGGLLNSTQTMVQTLLAAPLPVLIWVSPSGASATSAGVFITMAGHIAAMAPSSTIGAAHPVGGQGEDIQGDMREKVENFTASFGNAIAERRGRNVEWAEKAVRESVSITATEAVELGVVDFVAADLAELLRKCEGKEIELGSGRMILDFGAVLADGGPHVVEVEMTLRQRVLSVVADPNIAYLLMMAAMLGLYMEISNPGSIFPGVIGAICLLLALMAAQVLPISLVAMSLVLLGMGFLLAEFFTPSFGVLGVGGIAALTLGSLFLYTPDSGLLVDRRLIAATVMTFAGCVSAILMLFVSDRRRRPRTGSEGIVGEVGVASSAIGKRGTVKVHGEIWNARSEQPIAAGAAVVIEQVEGMRVRVAESNEERS